MLYTIEWANSPKPVPSQRWLDFHSSLNPIPKTIKEVQRIRRDWIEIEVTAWVPQLIPCSLNNDTRGCLGSQWEKPTSHSDYYEMIANRGFRQKFWIERVGQHSAGSEHSHQWNRCDLDQALPLSDNSIANTVIQAFNWSELPLQVDSFTDFADT